MRAVCLRLIYRVLILAIGMLPVAGFAQDREPLLQIHGGIVYGQVDFSASNAPSDARIDAGVVPRGFEGGVETWFKFWAQRRFIGLIVDVEQLDLGSFDVITGPKIQYTSGSVRLGVRPFPKSRGTPEITLEWGPAVQIFPDPLVSLDAKSYELQNLRIQGFQAGLAFRQPVSHAALPTILRIDFAYVRPQKVLGAEEGGALDLGSTRGIRGTIGFEIPLTRHIGFDIGGHYGSYRLQYTQPGSTVPDSSSFQILSALGSLRLRF